MTVPKSLAHSMNSREVWNDPWNDPTKGLRKKVALAELPASSSSTFRVLEAQTQPVLQRNRTLVTLVWRQESSTPPHRTSGRSEADQLPPVFIASGVVDSRFGPMPRFSMQEKREHRESLTSTNAVVDRKGHEPLHSGEVCC